MTEEEEMKLRELAAGRCTLSSVTEALGSLSLWSKDGLDREICKAVEAEREACAKIAESKRHSPNFSLTSMPPQNGTAVDIANAIRARGQA